MSRSRITTMIFRIFLYLLVIVLINVAGMSLYFRLDLTRDNMYSLSEVSKKTVSTLSEPLTIKVFFSQGLPPPYNTTQRYLRDLLQEYSLHANKNFNYQFYNIGPESEQIEEAAKNYGLSPMQVQVVQKDELKYKKAYMGAVILHGDAVEKLPAITSSKRLEYQLTSAIQNLGNKVSALLNLQEKIKVKLYMSSSLEKVAPYMGIEDLAELPEKTENIVKELNRQNYGKLDFVYIDPGPKGQSDHEPPPDIQHLQWPDLEKEGVKAGQGSIGLLLDHGGQSRAVDLLDIYRMPLVGTQYELITTSNLKEAINENVQTLLGINQSLGYLAGHGCPPLQAYPPQRSQSSLTAFQEIVSENYNIKNITLKDGIPEGLNCLVIAGPTKKFTDYELYQIDQALMRGTNLALFMDAFKREQNLERQNMTRSPIYLPNRTGLDKLVSHYGIKLNESIVLDKNCYKQSLSQQQGGGERLIYFAPIIKNKNINHRLDFMKNIKGLVAFQNSPLQLNKQDLDKHQVKAHQLFSSSSNSWLMKERINYNPMMHQPPESSKRLKQRPLAYLVSGSFSSYFKNKPVPAKEEENKKKNTGEEPKQNLKNSQKQETKIQAAEKTINQSGATQLFITGSSQLVTDTLLDPKGQTPNSIFLMNVLDQLSGRIEMARLRSKVQEFNPLQETSSSTRTMIKTFNIICLPFLVIIFGAFIWLQRKRRKRKIQSMFQ